MDVNALAVSDSVDSVKGHPLDPLSAVEIHRVADLCRAYAEEHGCGPIRFNTIGLRVRSSYAVLDEPSLRRPHLLCPIYRVALANDTYTTEYQS